METRTPTLDVVCRGKPREMGEQLGHGLRERILDASEKLEAFEAFRVQRPWWLPFDWFRQWSEWRAMGMLRPPIASSFPSISARIEGMADGAQVRESTLYLFHALESMALAPDQSARPAAPMSGCSAIAAPPTATSMAQPLLAHNLDGVDLLGESLVVREHQNAGQYRAIGLSCAPLSGMVDGVNERGLAITYNWAFAVDHDQMAAPVSVAIDDALATCSTVSEAAERISKQRRFGGAMLMLGDESGDIAALELSNRRVRLRRPQRGRPLYHSNQYRSQEMQSAQVARDAVFQNGAPQPLHGCRVLDSPERRDHRLRELLRQERKLCLDSITQLLSDHGDEGAADDGTLCMHGELWTTQANIQLLPTQRKLRVSYGPTCQAKHVEFQL